MSGYKSFAIAGGGNVGQPVIEELSKLKKEGIVSSIVLLTRATGKSATLLTGQAQADQDYFVSLGVTIATVNYDDPSSLVPALKGVDVVVSTLPAQLDSQDKLAVAAKEAGVKLFVPSEFGFPTKGQTVGIFGIKDRFRQKLEQLGLAFSCFYTGMFSDTTFIPYFGFDLPNGTALVGGNGDNNISWTSSRDIARFLTHVLTALPTSKVNNSFFSIEGERSSINKILEQYQERTGKTIKVEILPLEKIEAAVNANPTDLANRLRLKWNADATVGEVSNAAYPEWNPKKVIDVLVG